MTQQGKQLVFKALCEQLPYGLYVQAKSSTVPIELRYLTLDSIPNVKPYLRPLRSMTEEEYNNIDWEGCRHVVYYDENGFRFVKIDSFTIPVLDYLNARHFDFRYLIEKGLALEAPEGMYEQKS